MIVYFLVHTSHSTHSSHSSHSSHIWSTISVLLGCVNDDCVRRQEHCSSRYCVLECNAQYLGWINDSVFEQVSKLSCLRIKSVIEVFFFFHFLDYSISFVSCIVCNLNDWIHDCILDNLYSDLFIGIFESKTIKFFREFY